MKRLPKVGDTGQQVFTVLESHSIDIADDAALAVLSTPSLIWYLEHAARDALSGVLEPSETSVGISVDVEHVAATPKGHQVHCVARVIHVDRTLVTFQVTAEDAHEPIARGVHKRRVVSIERFQAHVRKKMLG